MKKILIPIMMGMLCTPVIAEDVRQMMESLGYQEESLYKDVPPRYRPGSLEQFKKHQAHEQEPEAKNDFPAIAPDDFLHPRVFAKSESAAMIPFLLKLQKKNPTSAKITRKLGVTCLKNGQPREALHWFLQTYQRDRSDLESLWNMAALAYQLGEEKQTEQFLQEYVNADPHSSWGRMAKEFLKGRYASTSMNEGFKGEFSRFGIVEKGVAGSESDDSDGIMVIEGRRTNLESMVENWGKPVSTPPVTVKDAVKGKSGKVEKATKKPAMAEKKDLSKAKIARPAQKNSIEKIKAVAEPLSP
jgi:tetratricopeptide (TPR) repeat protein